MQKMAFLNMNDIHFLFWNEAYKQATSIGVLRKEKATQ